MRTYTVLAQVVLRTPLEFTIEAHSEEEAEQKIKEMNPDIEVDRIDEKKIEGLIRLS
jgi:hypothetical protein